MGVSSSRARGVRNQSNALGDGRPPPIDMADILGGYLTSAADSNPGLSVGDGFSDQYLEIPASDQFFWRRNRLLNLFSAQSGRGAWDLHRQVHLYHRVANGRLRRK